MEEVPLYQPCGQGDHIYVQIRREGLNTRDLTRRLSELFGLRDVDVGCAGQKDKQARVTQTFSLLLPGIREEEAGRSIKSNLPVEVLKVGRHGNKLKTGHLLGNAFTIVLEEPVEDAHPRAEEIAAAILHRGLPNYYGVQRFGAEGDNAEKGREILLGRGPRQHWLRRFLLSAFQSLLFNDYLAERIRHDWFGCILTGDLAKKTDTGGLFEVTEIEKEIPRFEAGEITYTGPIYGHKMRGATGEPGLLEASILEKHGVTDQMLRRGKLEGSRRPARLILPNLEIKPHELGLVFNFFLPKGSYATTVLREFTKTGRDPELDQE